jgi:short-subunit dehydrogenase involved in D-alanine esterification of teichoic acids
MDLSSVQKAADAIKQQFPEGVDVLCNNAGIMADEDKATKDGEDHFTNQNLPSSLPPSQTLCNCLYVFLRSTNLLR